MTVCPNCNYDNPDDAVQCEACYTPLPTVAAASVGNPPTCPTCAAPVQVGARFCGQCGMDLTQAIAETKAAPDSSSNDASSNNGGQAVAAPAEPATGAVETAAVVMPPTTSPPLAADAVETAAVSDVTRLQINRAHLLHMQTDRLLELPQSLEIVHIGKPNNRVPPDIDVSGFPDAEIVSRVHAHIRVEADAYYIEDAGSSNGTYINNLPLPVGNRHRLRGGDRIALGKGDKVTFLFQQG
jgi:endogenous inhibitor of DNA gyrase (YacG/DUF329 family)